MVFVSDEAFYDEDEIIEEMEKKFQKLLVQSRLG